MDKGTDWRQAWERESGSSVSDYELDRGRLPLNQEAEILSERELLSFIDPKDSETILDAGCGTGVNILRLHSRTRRIIAIDYAQGSLERCQQKIQARDIRNALLCVASVMAIPANDCSVDKILCMSVFQYLDDNEVRQALREFVRVLTPGGTIVLHVKNFSSLYWSTLWAAKRLKKLMGMSPRIEYLRPFRWYIKELKNSGLKILDYESYNLLMFDLVPQKLTSITQWFELKHHKGPFFRHPFVRRHGAELMIKAGVPVGHPESVRSEKARNPEKSLESLI